MYTVTIDVIRLTTASFDVPTYDDAMQLANAARRIDGLIAVSIEGPDGRQLWNHFVHDVQTQ